MSAPVIDLPDVVEDVTRQFWAYEKAFMANDVEALIDFFWSDSRLTRYGIADRQLGIEQMRAFRRASPAHRLHAAHRGPAHQHVRRCLGRGLL